MKKQIYYLLYIAILVHTTTEILAAEKTRIKFEPKTTETALHEEPLVFQEDKSKKKKKGTPKKLYVYHRNDKLAALEIVLNDRITEWYKGDKALADQGYLKRGTPMGRILTKEIKLCEGDKRKAMNNIILRHALPDDLIKDIILYGKIEEGASDEETRITTFIHYLTPSKESIYFQGEITGKLKDDTFEIWHSFLRPITNIAESLQKFNLSLDDLALAYSLEKVDQRDDRVIILQNGNIYVLFKYKIS